MTDALQWTLLAVLALVVVRLFLANIHAARRLRRFEQERASIDVSTSRALQAINASTQSLANLLVQLSGTVDKLAARELERSKDEAEREGAGLVIGRRPEEN